MSFILDALKKAAEQRAEPTPALRRLISASPVRSSSLLRSRLALGIAAAAVVGILAITLRPAAPPSRAVRDESPAAPAPLLAPAPPVPVERSTRATPSLASPLAGERSTRPAPALAPPSPERPRAEVPRQSVASVHVAPPPARVSPIVPAGRPQRPAAAPSGPAPAVSAPSPVTAPATPPENLVGLKLEVLVYSDVPAERMVFINGRKYVEGDTVPEGWRVEEIKQYGVVLSDQERRFTLRQ